MGSRRIGYKRLEKILENLKREINWGSATMVHANTVFARGYNTTVPSVITKWPAATADLGSGAKTITIAQILTGIILCDPAGDAAHTLPTAALAYAGVTGVAVGDCIDFTVINTGTASENEIITVAAGTNGSLVGSGAVLTANPVDDAFSSGSGLFRLRFTSVTGNGSYVCYRLA